MVKRTTMNLDFDLVAEARKVLGTSSTTDTVHAALRNVVRHRRLQELTEWDLDGLTLEGIKEMRRSRQETRSWGALSEQDADATPADTVGPSEDRARAATG